MIQLWQRLSYKTKVLLLLITIQFSSSIMAQNFDDAIFAYEQGKFDDAYNIFYELASLGHADALNNLGTLYQTGKGAPVNYLYAIKAYERAAKSGHIDAAYNASNLTRLGIGTKKDIASAYAWAILAARNGASDMIAYRDILKQKLTPEESARAREISKALLRPLEASELSIAWLLPSEMNDPLPKHIQKLNEKNKQSVIVKQNQQEEKKSALDVPTGFSALTPQHEAINSQENNFNNQSISKRYVDRNFNITPAPINENTIPDVFSPLTPNQNNQQSKATDSKSNFTMVNSNETIPEGFSQLTPQNNEQYDNTNSNHSNDNLIVPAGFTALQTNTPLETYQKKEEEIQPEDKIVRSSSLSTLFTEGYTFLKPLDDSTPNQERNNLDSNESKNKYDPFKQKTYPTAMGNPGQTIYRPQTESIHYDNATTLKPRRIVAPQEITLNATRKVSESLNIIVTNIARANGSNFDTTLKALQNKNPDLVLKNDEGIYIITDPNRTLKIPSSDELSSP